MKLNFGKRLLLVLQCLLSLIVCAFLLLVFLAPGVVASVEQVVNGVLGAGMAEMLSIALLALCAIVAVFSLIVVLRRDKNRGERGFITVDSSETGKTRIAIGAVDQMVRQAVRGVSGIGEMKCSIVNNEDSISINAVVTLLSGAHVPTVTMNMQRAIRGYIELNCGVAVRDICVSVSSVENAEGKKGAKRGMNAVSMESSVQPVPVQEPVAEAAPVEQEMPAEEIPLEEPAQEVPAEDEILPEEE